MATLATGCSGFIDNQAATSTLKILQASQTAALRVPDVELARAALPGGILQLDAFAIAYPKRREFRVLHAMALCQYATAFVFDDWETATLAARSDEAAHAADRLAPLLASCVDANLELLPPAWRAARVRGPDAVVALMPSATRAQVPQLIAIATADASRLALAPFARLADLPMIRAMLERATALLPGALEARGELLLGTLAAGQSQFMGGDDGSAYFQRARTLAGEQNLLVDVLYARAVAVAHGDRALFETTLARVLAADVTRWPDRRLPNAIARQKAQRYLDAEGTLLPPPAPPTPPGSGASDGRLPTPGS